MTPHSSVSPTASSPWARVQAWLGRLYARVESYANTPAALTALLVVAAIDSAFFPVPPFVLLVPMIVATPHRWLRLTVLSLLASVVGSLLGYAIGTAMRDGLQFIHVDLNLRLDLGPEWLHKVLLGLAALCLAAGGVFAVQAFRRRPLGGLRTGIALAIAGGSALLSSHVDWFNVHGTLGELLGRNWWTLAAACMLAPAFKLATIGSGLVGVPLPAFLAAVALARLVRFGILAALARFGGPTLRDRLLQRAQAHRLQSNGSPAVET